MTPYRRQRPARHFVLVDLEGTATDRIGFAITQSDLVLIPVQGSVLDASEAAKSIKLIRQMSHVANREIPYAVFFTRKSAAIREKTLRDIEVQFASAGVPSTRMFVDRPCGLPFDFLFRRDDSNYRRRTGLRVAGCERECTSICTGRVIQAEQSKGYRVNKRDDERAKLDFGDEEESAVPKKPVINPETIREVAAQSGFRKTDVHATRKASGGKTATPRAGSQSAKANTT